MPSWTTVLILIQGSQFLASGFAASQRAGGVVVVLEYYTSRIEWHSPSANKLCVSRMDMTMIPSIVPSVFLRPADISAKLPMRRQTLPAVRRLSSLIANNFRGSTYLPCAC